MSYNLPAPLSLCLAEGSVRVKAGEISPRPDGCSLEIPFRSV